MTDAAEGRPWATHEPPWANLLNHDLDPHAQHRMTGTLKQRAARLAAETHGSVDQLEHAQPVGAAFWYSQAAALRPPPEPEPEPVVKPREVGTWPCQIPPAPTCPDCGDELAGGPFAAAIHRAVYACRDREHLQRRRRNKLRSQPAHG